MTMN